MHNNRINLTRISRVRFWALLAAREGYANRSVNEKMEEKDDWRLTNQEDYLKGVTLVHRKYRQYPKNSEWDHDHCAFCWAKFWLYDDPEYLKEGYATTDDYHWICPQCFQDFKDRFQWKVIEAENTTEQTNQGDGE